MLGVPTWVVITVALFVAIVIMLKYFNQVYFLTLIKDNFFYFFVILVLVFLTISLTHIHAKYGLDFSTSEGVKGAAKIYLSWLGNVYGNVAKITGYAVQQDWTSAGNSTK